MKHFWYSHTQAVQLIKDGNKLKECIVKGVIQQYTLISNSENIETKCIDLIYIGKGHIVYSNTEAGAVSEPI